MVGKTCSQEKCHLTRLYHSSCLVPFPVAMLNTLYLPDFQQALNIASIQFTIHTRRVFTGSETQEREGNRRARALPSCQLRGPSKAKRLRMPSRWTPELKNISCL